MSVWMGLFDNESRFGKAVTKLGILIGANLMFVFFSLPVVTMGASLCGLYYVILKCQRGDGMLNPFRTFWKGFADNFKEATFFWIAILGGLTLIRLEIFWCSQFSGPVREFRYGLEGLAVMLLVFGMYVFPVLSAFRAPVGRQISNALFFAGRSVLILLLLGISWAAPFALTYLFGDWLPLAAFFWCFFGFSGLAWLQGGLLLHLFTPYLPAGKDLSQPVEGNRKKHIRATLGEMRRMGM